MKTIKANMKLISGLIAIVVFCLIFVDLIEDGRKIYLETTPSVDISTGWENLDTDEEEERKNISVLPGATLILSRTLPDNLNDDNVVGYYDRGFRVMAYVDDEEIYTESDGIYGRFGTEISQEWKAIPLRKEYSGKTFTILFENDTDSAKRINLGRMEITYKSSEVVRAFTTSKLAIAIILPCLLMGVILMLFSVTQYKAGFKDSCFRMLELGGLSIDVGLWSWANCSLCQLIFVSNSFAYKLSYITYFLIPCLMGMFYERILEDRNRIFRLMNITYGWMMIAAFLLYLTGVVPLAQSVFLTHVFIFSELTVGSVYSIKDYRRERNHTNHWSMVGQFIFLIVSAVYIPLYYLRGEENVFLYAGVAFLAFLFCMTMSQGIYMVMDLNEQRKQNEVMEQISIDPVSGGNSYSGLMQVLENMDFTGIDAPWFVLMEITNTAGINALFGWRHGEHMKKGLYEANQEVIKDNGYQAMIGEAEFAFIFPAETDIEDVCARITMGLEQYMAQNWENAFICPRFGACRINPKDTLSKLTASTRLARIGLDSSKLKHTSVNYYNGECSDRIMKGQVLANEVNRALVKRTMQLLFVPEFDASTRKICMADTMLAWNIKAEGDMFEFQFIPQEQKDALGIRMNTEHLEKAMEFMQTYPDFKEIRISVRLFRDCLMNTGFWDRFMEGKDRYNIGLERFDFELPLELGEHALPTLKQIVGMLKRDGATVSASGFDGSFGMLWMIKELDLDWVKFSPHLFALSEEVDEDLYKQIHHFIGQLHEQGQKVCMCGVNDWETAEKLKEAGADRVSGNGLHLPMLEEEFVRLMNDKEEQKA